MMKLLVADKLEDEALRALRAIPGLEVANEPALARDALPAALEGVAILVVRSREVRAPAIEAGKRLALIVRAGAGTNTIDVEAASARGVYVANCPGKNAVAVAELALGLIIALDRRIPDATTALRAGRWEKGEYGKADGLYGKRVGIAGLGAIGLEVLARVRAMGMLPRAYSRSLTAERAQVLGVEYAATLADLAAQSDVFTVHLPLSPQTRGAIGAAVLDALPARAIVVNTARAEVMDYDALRAAVAARGLRVGLDVFPGEPEGARGEFASDLLALPGLVATPHVGASTQQAQLAIAHETVRIVRAFLETGQAPNCVNIAARSPARCQLIVRHYDRVGVLANVLGVIKKHGINVEEMSNTPFAGHKAAVAALRLAVFPDDQCLREIEGSSGDVIHVEALHI